MTADFDVAAKTYDAKFTNSVIGTMQRRVVYDYLAKLLWRDKVQFVLEINCGTGADAAWMVKKGADVTATDISAEMIAIANEKVHSEYARFMQADIIGVAKLFENEQYDLIFSNFGGLNCLKKSDLRDFFNSCESLLPSGAKITLVLMPKNSLWERAYFMAKGKFETAKRRSKTDNIANIDGRSFPVYYYDPKEIIELANEHYDLVNVKPIGFFIPPSYLENKFAKRKRICSLLFYLESKIRDKSFLSRFSDHYVITLEKR